MKKILFVFAMLMAAAGVLCAECKTAAQRADEATGEKWYRWTVFPVAFASEPVSEMISIDTIPSGAEVVVDGNSVGTTPITVEYRRKKAPVVVLKKAGYPDQQLRIRRRANHTAVVDGIASIFVIPCIWTYQDWSYDIGCMLEYSEKNVIVELQQFGEGVKSVKPESYNGHVELRPYKK
ncbi:MAG: PEGA domain-containing protein [Opitutales bacterium]|nr:PEGA domain-containing protein [Opitutales bacterium]